MTATIGPDAWANATLNNIKLSQKLMQRSDKFNDLGHKLDPLPSLRDKCIQQSNAQIHSYARETREVVGKLQHCLVETEEEIKSLQRGRERLEKVLEHIRKDIILNDHSSSGRKSKPFQERGTDGADDMLDAEKRQLLKIKKSLEAHLRSAQKQLQILGNARVRLKSALSERSRVIDLMPQTFSGPRSRGRSREHCDGVVKTSDVNPVGPYTPECDQSIALANDAIQKSKLLLQEIASFIDQSRHIQKEMHKSVNDGITKKASETIAMKQHLQLTKGENRSAIHRSNRWHYTTDIARGYTLGPVALAELTTRERLDRPVVKRYQRHPGTQLPEAQKIIEGNFGIQKSLEAISRNIGMLKLTGENLNHDIRCKTIGAEVDANVVRERRRRGNHRWVVGGLTC